MEADNKSFPRRVTGSCRVLGCAGHPGYLVSGDKRSVLVEGGVSATVPLVRKQMASIPEAAPLSHLIATHSHADHSTGLLRMKKENPGLAFCATRETGRVLSDEKIRSRLLSEDVTYSESLFSKGIVSENPGRLMLSSVSLDQVLADGDVLDLAGVTITFYETPGHAPGALSSWVMPDRLLLISDAAGFSDDGKNIYPMFFQDLGLYLASIDRLAALTPSAVGLGHHLIIRGDKACAEFFARAKEETLFMASCMKSREENGEPRDRVAKTWADRLRSFDFFSEFPEETLMGYARLLCRRALEK